MSKLEDALAGAMRWDPDVPPFEQEHRFHETRKWRLDFAWPELKVGVEVNGGTFSRGRHVQGMGSVGDAEKSNALQMAGWTVITLTSKDFVKRRGRPIEVTGAALALVREAVRGATDGHE